MKQLDGLVGPSDLELASRGLPTAKAFGHQHAWFESPQAFFLFWNIDVFSHMFSLHKSFHNSGHPCSINGGYCPTLLNFEITAVDCYSRVRKCHRTIRGYHPLKLLCNVYWIFPGLSLMIGHLQEWCGLLDVIRQLLLAEIISFISTTLEVIELMVSALRTK
jgi:hypothetical protein